MNKLLLFLILILFVGCKSTKETNVDSELIGVWLAPAPVSEGIFYRPNLLVDITPDRMTTYEDVTHPTEFSWKQNGSTITYENDDQKNTLEIVDNQTNRMKVTLEGGDSLQFFRLSANENTTFTDADIFNHIFSQTFEIIIQDLNWQIRQLLFLPGGTLVKYDSNNQTKDKKTSPNFSTGNWQLLVIRNHYFLFLHSLQDEKPLLIYLEEFSEFRITGKMAYANNLYPVNINSIGSEVDLAAIHKTIEGNWKNSYTFNVDSTFSQTADNDTLNGIWDINSTGEVIILKKDANTTAQFGFINTNKKTIDMNYLQDFHNEFTIETIKRN